MKKFWCLLLIALLLLGCAAEPEAAVVQVSPAPETDAPQHSPAPGDAYAPAPSETPSAVPTEAPTEPPTPEPTLSPDERLLRYVEAMSDADKIGQLCMFGFSGTREISKEFRAIVRDYRVGNVILYGQNIVRSNGDGGFSMCRKLTDSVKSASDSEIPMLISIDVEGGKVTRFHWDKTLLGARALGKRNDTDLAAQQFQAIAEGLLSAGINTDLAPCLDVCETPDSHFLGTRIISANAETAARIGAACVDGLHAGGCLSIIKHFPGHGASTTDSHDSTPVVYKSLEMLKEYELIPFEAVLPSADGVMLAHILYKKIDGEHIATLSERFVTGLLREEYGYTGLIVSDDYRMNGLRKQCSLGEAAVQFILAGGDLILCGAVHSYQKQILKGLYDAVADGTISAERLNESVCRILRAKMRVTGWNPLDETGGEP